MRRNWIGVWLLVSGCSLSLGLDELSSSDVDGGAGASADASVSAEASPDAEAGTPCEWGLSTETRFTTSGMPFALDVADFDDDGLIDVVLAENEVWNDIRYAYVQVFLNRGARELEGFYTAFKNGVTTRGMAAGDVDGDGKPDAFQAYNDWDTKSGVVQLHRGVGNGNLDSGSIHTVNAADDVTLGDFDGDGRLDAAASATTDKDGYADQKLHLLWNDGGSLSGISVVYQNAGFTNTLRELATAKLNDDAADDLLVASWGDDTVRVLMGSSDRGFFLRPSVTVGTGVKGMAAADLNGDNIADLATVATIDGTVSILPGTGDGYFGAEQVITLTKNIIEIVATDLNGDGATDLAVAGTDEIITLLNQGDGTFAEPRSFPLEGTPGRFAAADIDQDGHVDLIVSNLSRKSFSVYFGQCKPAS